MIKTDEFKDKFLSQVPAEVFEVMDTLDRHGFDAYLVGGFVRDLLLGVDIDDFDITTNATPDEIQSIFPKSFYNNNFFTVGVLTEIGEVQVTTYRTESDYFNRRHPSSLKFASSLREDAERRDFTINALAIDKFGNIYDYTGGIDDLKSGTLKAVGSAEERFNEDALRILRAIRFASRLNFKIEEKTALSLKRTAHLLGMISAERIRDELIKMVSDTNAYKALQMLDKMDILVYIVPELLMCKGVDQRGHHIYDVFNHLIYSLKNCPSRKLEVRMASLFHDIGKPQTLEERDGINTFYGHEFMSEKITKDILNRLKFSKEKIKYITHLVRNHMFFYDENVTDSAVRRALKKIGPENLEDFIDLRVADRLGSGTKKAKSWRLLEFEKRAFEVRHHPINDHDLNISGEEIMKDFNLRPGKIIGEIKNHLLNLVIEDPARNNKDFLYAETRRYIDGNPTGPKMSREELSMKQKDILVRDF
jgi:tRNA nucleotidyltransferase (CCA-adding enzyme)